MDASRFYVGEAFGKLGIDDPALLGRILILGARRFLNDCDDATSGSEFQILPAFKPGLSQGSRRNDNGRFIFDGDGHSSSYAGRPVLLSVYGHRVPSSNFCNPRPAGYGARVPAARAVAGGENPAPFLPDSFGANRATSTGR
jgi:hypothetical protein